MTRALLLLLFAAPAAVAETAYVTDKLQLGVHAASDTSDRAFTSIPSGEPVEVLESDGAYTRVRLQDGRVGWVRNAFLVTEEPALQRLAKVEAERDGLASRLAEIESRNDNAGDRLSALETEAATARQGRREAEAALAEAQAQLDALRSRLAPGRVSVSLTLLLAAALLLPAAGFGLGWWYFDRLSRRRHGGVRVY